MTREALKNQASPYYTKVELKILLRGFDIGMAHAEEMLHKAIIDETTEIQTN